MVASLEINKGSGRETPSAKLFGREDGERRQALCILVRIGMEESSIDGTLLHPYPYKNAERLATFSVFSAEQFRAWRFPARAFVDFKGRNHTFDDMFGLVYREVRFTSANGSEEFSGGSVTPGTFEALGIAPSFGRGLRADDYRPGAPPVFVISYGLWTKLFNRAPNVLGNTYRLNGAP